MGVVGWFFSFLFNPQKKLLFGNSGEPDQTQHFAASNLFFFCLPMSHEKDARLIWVNKKCHSSALKSALKHDFDTEL